MTLQHIGRLIADRRRAKGLTLSALATRASVGRSTLAALESGKLTELGLTRVARICSVVDLTIDIRPHHLQTPIMLHRHLTEVASRELSHAAIDDIVTRGNVEAWRKLVSAMRADKSMQIADRVRRVTTASGKHDCKARAFAALLPKLLRAPRKGTMSK